jgi:hypothetical protein
MNLVKKVREDEYCPGLTPLRSGLPLWLDATIHRPRVVDAQNDGYTRLLIPRI